MMFIVSTKAVRCKVPPRTGRTGGTFSRKRGTHTRVRCEVSFYREPQRRENTLSLSPPPPRVHGFTCALWDRDFKPLMYHTDTSHLSGRLARPSAVICVCCLIMLYAGPTRTLHSRIRCLRRHISGSSSSSSSSSVASASRPSSARSPEFFWQGGEAKYAVCRKKTRRNSKTRGRDKARGCSKARSCSKARGVQQDKGM